MDSVRYIYNNGEFDYNHSVFKENLRFDLHVHDRYELFYFLSGDVGYRIEGQMFNLNRGDILIINNKELHQPVFYSDAPYERITMHFKPEYVLYYNTEGYNILRYFEKRKLGIYNKIEAGQLERNGIINILKKIERYISNKKPETDIMVKITFIELLVCLNSIYEEMKLSLPVYEIFDETISKIIDYINGNLMKKISLDVLSKKFLLSKYYICHKFKEATGFSVVEYTTYKRITYAKELLLSGTPPSTAALMTGFNDYPGFYKAFCKYTSMSPRKYAEKSRI